jgi:uncharacterized membrane protein required for colicin V production
MNDWNGLDFLIFLIFAMNTILGMTRGATKEIISTLCLSVGLIFSIRFCVPLTNFLSASPLIADVIDNSMTVNFMSSIGAAPLTTEFLRQFSFSMALMICFTASFSACEAALSLPSVMEVFSFPYAMLNKKVGAGLGCLRGFVLNVILVNILVLHLFNTSGNETVKNSVTNNSHFVAALLPTAKKLDTLIEAQNPDRYREIYQDKDVIKVDGILKALSPDEKNPLDMPQPQAAPAQNAPATQQGESPQAPVSEPKQSHND